MNAYLKVKTEYHFIIKMLHNYKGVRLGGTQVCGFLMLVLPRDNPDIANVFT